MALQRTRRSILGTASVLLPTTAGCVGTIATPEDDRNDEPTDRTDHGRTSRTRPTGGGRGRSDDLYLDNETDHERFVSVTITTDGDRTYFEGQYRVPAQTRVRITDVGKVGELFDVVVTVDDRLRTAFSWRVLPCTDDEGSLGNTDVEIDVFEDRLRFRKNECDLVAIESDAPFQNASKFRTTTEATASYRL